MRSAPLRQMRKVNKECERTEFAFGLPAIKGCVTNTWARSEAQEGLHLVDKGQSEKGEFRHVDHGEHVKSNVGLTGLTPAQCAGLGNSYLSVSQLRLFVTLADFLWVLCPFPRSINKSGSARIYKICFLSLTFSPWFTRQEAPLFRAGADLRYRISSRGLWGSSQAWSHPVLFSSLLTPLGSFGGAEHLGLIFARSWEASLSDVYQKQSLLAELQMWSIQKQETKSNDFWAADKKKYFVYSKVLHGVSN